jgi:hypothetical protein
MTETNINHDKACAADQGDHARAQRKAFLNEKEVGEKENDPNNGDLARKQCK